MSQRPAEAARSVLLTAYTARQARATAATDGRERPLSANPALAPARIASREGSVNDSDTVQILVVTRSGHGAGLPGQSSEWTAAPGPARE